MLEIGALSPKNHAAKQSYIANTPIDLNSQHPDILAQDFLQRPLPKTEDEKFDIVSCSLVLNFVPEPRDRGEFAGMERDTSLGKSNILVVYRPYAQTDSSAITAFRAVLPVPRASNGMYGEFEIHDVRPPSSSVARHRVRTSQETRKAWRKSHLYPVEKAGIFRSLARSSILQEADRVASRRKAEQFPGPCRLGSVVVASGGNTECHAWFIHTSRLH